MPPIVLPNFSSIKSLQDLSGVIALPMLIASYIAQTGMNFIFEDITITLSGELSWLFAAKFIFIFLMKALTCSVVFGLVIVIINLLDHYTKVQWSVISGVIVLSFGFYGVFNHCILNDKICKVIDYNLHPSWFISAFSVGFFFFYIGSKSEGGKSVV